jgi:hypothetical protein
VWVNNILLTKMETEKRWWPVDDRNSPNDSAIEAAMQFVFTPAYMNNGPVMVWVSLPFRFQIKEIKSPT